MVSLRKLRHGWKDTASESHANARHTGVATFTSKANKPTFFDLPAEIRNAVYELVANDTVITIPVRRKEAKLLVPVPGLLLASRQCRKEYLPLLYATAPVKVEVNDFDFRNVVRITGGLYRTELKALRANRNLVIRLSTQNCTRENLNSLRKWLVNRADSLDRLPWRYEVVCSQPMERLEGLRLSRELMSYCETLSRMQISLEDTLQWELHAIINAFERKGIELDNVLNSAIPQDLRGLSGEGVG